MECFNSIKNICVREAVFQPLQLASEQRKNVTQQDKFHEKRNLGVLGNKDEYK